MARATPKRKAALATEPSDYQQVLLELAAADLPFFVEGGQAVNIWASLFEGQEQSLKDFRPYTSKDCDVWVGPTTFRELKARLLNHAVKLKVGFPVGKA